MDIENLVVSPADVQERERRLRQIENVVGSSRIEGLEIDPEGRAVLDRYIDGELSIDELLPAMLKLP